MIALRRLAAAPLLFTVLLVALPGAQQADATRETFARATIELASGNEASLRYRTIAWSVEGTRRMRQDASIRQQMNQRLQLAMQTELKTPVALAVNGRRLEPDTYRVGLAMNEAGAYEFTMLLDHDTVHFPIELAESNVKFPYLAFSLVPCEAGVFALVFQWGSEYGRVVFARAS